MKKVFSVIICVFMVLSLSSCTVTNKQAEKDEREKYVELYKILLRGLDATLSQGIIEDEKYADSPWVQDRIQLPDSDIIVSLDELRASLYIYEINNLYAENGQETISLTAEDIISLYSTPNTEKYAELEKLFHWYNVGMSDNKRDYYRFAYVAYNLYKEKHGKPFLDKEWKTYCAEDTYALVKWAIGNIDYDYIDKIIATPKQQYEGGDEKYYVKYLYYLGLIDVGYYGGGLRIGVVK